DGPLELERHRREAELTLEVRQERRAEDAVLDPFALLLHDEVPELHHPTVEPDHHVRHLRPRDAALADALDRHRIVALELTRPRPAESGASHHRRLRAGVEEEEEPPLLVEGDAHHRLEAPEEDVLPSAAARLRRVDANPAHLAFLVADEPVELLQQVDSEHAVEL